MFEEYTSDGGADGWPVVDAKASERARIWLVTHSRALADAVIASGAGKVRTVVKRDGATMIEGLKAWGAFEEDDED